MKLKDLEKWLTPTDVAKIQGLSQQAVVKRLDEGRGGYRAVYTRQGWLIDPASVEDAAVRREQKGY